NTTGARGRVPAATCTTKSTSTIAVTTAISIIAVATTTGTTITIPTTSHAVATAISIIAVATTTGTTITIPTTSHTIATGATTRTATTRAPTTLSVTLYLSRRRHLTAQSRTAREVYTALRINLNCHHGDLITDGNYIFWTCYLIVGELRCTYQALFTRQDFNKAAKVNDTTHRTCIDVAH